MLVGVCGVGLLLGWWLMGVLVGSGNERPPLVPRIQSLPAFAKLPVLAGGKRDFVDSIESPGAPVWVLLGPDPRNPDSLPLVCGFARGAAGAVVAPECTTVARDLRQRFQEAKFAADSKIAEAQRDYQQIRDAVYTDAFSPYPLSQFERAHTTIQQYVRTRPDEVRQYVASLTQ